MNEIEKVYFSTAEVAKRFDVTERTVARWVKSGLFPGAKKKSPQLRSPYRIPQSAIDYFESKLVEPS